MKSLHEHELKLKIMYNWSAIYFYIFYTWLHLNIQAPSTRENDSVFGVACYFDISPTPMLILISPADENSLNPSSAIIYLFFNICNCPSHLWPCQDSHVTMLSSDVINVTALNILKSFTFHTLDTWQALGQINPTRLSSTRCLVERT